MEQKQITATYAEAVKAIKEAILESRYRAARLVNKEECTPEPTLLCSKLFGRDFEDAHDAASDIEATQQCFWELRKKGLI